MVATKGVDMGGYRQKGWTWEDIYKIYFKITLYFNLDLAIIVLLHTYFHVKLVLIRVVFCNTCMVQMAKSNYCYSCVQIYEIDIYGVKIYIR